MFIGVSQTSGYLFRGPNRKVDSICESIFGFPSFGKLLYRIWGVRI